MKQQCINAVQQAAGRVLKAAEIQGIEDRILSNMRQLAREDRQAWSAMSDTQRLQEAAKRASDELVAEAIRKKQAVIKDAQIMAGIQSFADARVKAGDSYLDAVDRKLAQKRDLQGGTSTVSLTAKAIYADITRNLTEVLDQTGKWGGLFQNKEGVEALIRELHGENTGIPEAKAAAKAIHDAGEAARQQFNAEGGHIGKLEDYAMPSFHEQRSVWKAGRDQWVADILGKLKREKYVNEDGSLMDDTQLTQFLGKAWESIAWNGQNKVQVGSYAGGKRADRGSAHRQIHFKDADSYMEYQAKYGTDDPLHLIFGHYNRIAKDIAMVKELGSNPDRMIEHLAQWAMQKDVTERNVYEPEAKHKADEVLKTYNYIAGYGEPVGSEVFKQIGDTLTGLNVAAKLGSAVISAVNDQATIVMASKTLGMPVMKTWRNQLSAWNLTNAEEKNWARRQGLAHEVFSNEIQRWGTDYIANSWAGKMGSFIMKVSGLNAWTQAEKRAFGMAIYDLMGDLSRKHADMTTLEPTDRLTLERIGVTEQDFQIWRQAKVESRNGMNDTVLTPDAIYAVQGVDDAAKRDAAQKLIAAALLDTDVAIPTPNERERADLYGGVKRGTWKGELIRQVALFKATPYTQFIQHWNRMMDQAGAGNRFKYAAAYLTLTTLTGAFSMEINEMLSGKDPKDFVKNPVRVGLAAVLKGGGLGFFGDFMFADKTLQGQTGALSGMMGPSMSTAEALVNLTVGNAAKSFQGKDTHVAADAAQLVKSMTPGINLWYLKAVINHLWLQNIQDVLEPGYAARMEMKAYREFGQQFWWRPSETLPSRGPDIGKAVGQ